MCALRPSRGWSPAGRGAPMNKEADVIERAPSPRFRWLERGDGDPVVLLHGLMGEMDHWESALESLGAFCRPIALELPLLDAGLVDVSVAGPARSLGPSPR